MLIPSTNCADPQGPLLNLKKRNASTTTVPKPWTYPGHGHARLLRQMSSSEAALLLAIEYDSTASNSYNALLPDVTIASCQTLRANVKPLSEGQTSKNKAASLNTCTSFIYGFACMTTW